MEERMRARLTFLVTLSLEIKLAEVIWGPSQFHKGTSPPITIHCVSTPSRDVLFCFWWHVMGLHSSCSICQPAKGISQNTFNKILQTMGCSTVYSHEVHVTNVSWVWFNTHHPESQKMHRQCGKLRGHPYMMSPNFWDFLTPSPLVRIWDWSTVLNSCNLPY